MGGSMQATIPHPGQEKHVGPFPEGRTHMMFLGCDLHPRAPGLHLAEPDPARRVVPGSPGLWCDAGERPDSLEARLGQIYE